MKKRILSGMRPTGKLHLGHLVGALNNWASLQENYDNYYMVADWHALMSEYANPKSLRNYIFDNVSDWLSCGIDPEKSVVFIQSEVREHLELDMFLSCITPLGWLERCPTYKEQLKEIKDKDISNYAFLGYPVLQAADILLYRSEVVPVGQDQLPHLELTREIARRFNSLYKKKIFPEPEALLTKTPKLLGLDGRKMSKSYNNTINLSDTKDEIIKKIGNMITDPKRIKLNDPGHPDICNVYDYFKVFNPKQTKEVRAWCEGATIGCTQCKKKFAENILEVLEPIQVKRAALAESPDYIAKVLSTGAEKARNYAAGTIKQVKELFNWYV
jgi:tryptophanyl-tRNA synthetase